MAPNANVLYYGAASCYDDDLLASLARIVNDDEASIVTNSWGEPTFVVVDGVTYPNIDSGLVAAYESVFKQGALEGIGFNFSSGDDGDEYDAYGIAHPDWPTEDPWVTSVGGTALAIGQDGTRQFETGWGTEKYGLNSAGSAWTLTVPFLYGAGGGFVNSPLMSSLVGTTFPEPAYQRTRESPLRPAPRSAGRRDGRRSDDRHARRRDPELPGRERIRAGGRALRRVPHRRNEPRIAALRRCRGGRAGHRPSDRLRQPAHLLARAPGVFYDVTPQGDPGNVRSDFVNGVNASNGIVYSVRTFDQDSSLTTGTGWDDVTGLGSVTSSYIAAMSH